MARWITEIHCSRCEADLLEREWPTPEKKGLFERKPPPAQPEGVEKTRPSPPEQKSKPLPPAVVAAWEKAGFDAGWLGPHKKYGYIDFSESLKELEASKAVPAFKAVSWEPGMLEPLSAPTSAFGLYLSETDITPRRQSMT